MALWSKMDLEACTPPDIEMKQEDLRLRLNEQISLFELM
jgi:hypothetical protein